MTSRTAVLEKVGPAGSSARDLAPGRRKPLPILVLSAWCGLVSGWLEVGTIVLRKRTVDLNHLYGMSREFVWLIPTTNLVVFLAMGIVLWVVVRVWPCRGDWLAAQLLCTLTLLPAALVAFPRIYGLAWLAVAAGVAARLVPVIQRHTTGFRRLVSATLPIAAGLVPALAASLLVGDRIEGWRMSRRPLPAPGSPNVLFIVLDTVAADHLGLYGYNRPTSPTLDELASRGIRFDRAQATSSWTLPSHASLFTGRWPHELSAGWLTPLDATFPTLAEFLASRGYATSGFVANNTYCASDSGLGRGFADYRDHIFPRLTAFKDAALVKRPSDWLNEAARFLEDRLDLDLLRPAAQQLMWWFRSDRKGSTVVDREFLDWLSRRRQPERPFFAFLNYFDAHCPYELPPGRLRRFGTEPGRHRDTDLIQNWWPMDKSKLSTRELALASNSYDDCIADLDEELGRLFDELERRALLERTWVIIAADHGESFGEHHGVFCHGTSLYQTELHVPLVIIPPGPAPSIRVVAEPVSLLRLPATIVDVLGFRAASPFPGDSLAGFWNQSSSVAPAGPVAPGRALSEVVPIDPLNLNPSQWDKPRWPLAALTDGEWTYIRREGDVREELFHVREDAQELHDLADNPATRPTLERMREALEHLTAGPLTPRRFNP
jgi:arylsulfatase A-like enzyme